MRKTILILVLSISAPTLYSQQDSLLKKFKFRNSNYRAIAMSISGSSQFYNASFPPGKYKNQSSFGGLGASYYNARSTDKILLNISGGISSSFNSGRTKNPNDDYKNRSFYLLPQFSVLNKRFSGKFFIELGADVSANFYTNKNTGGSIPGTLNENQNEQSLALTAGIGKGRLENITDMQNAIWLFKALEKEGRLSRSLFAEELNDLGRAITAANNTRVLDSRRRTQFILETIDNYFQQKGLISKTDIKYFSNLNDIVFFAFNDPRLSGTETFIRVSPAIMNFASDLSQQPPASKNEQNSTTKSARLSIGLNKYTPVNLRHQNNYGVALQLSYLTNHYNDKSFNSGVLTGEIELNPILRQAGINLFFGHAIYPNTRTIISFNPDSQTGYQGMGQQSGFLE